MNLIGGVEEAGRGPVIGPMVMAIVVLEKQKLPYLEQLGVKDSKMLTPKRRDFLFDKIMSFCKCEYLIVSPKEIDDALNSDSMNLNLLEAKISADLIKKVSVDYVIMDSPSSVPHKHTEVVRKFLDKDVQLFSEHKADENYVIVGAASIIAKVVRDREIEKIRKEVNFDFGSGYPSDPKTKEFIKLFWDKHPDIFRKSWKTYKKIASSSSQKSLSGF